MKTSFRSVCLWVGVVLLSLANIAQAANVLIINGSTLTSEPGTTSSITSTLETLLQSQGNTTTISDPVPASLAGYDQIWDIRFSNSSPVSAGERAQFISFMQSGGAMFVMGENGSFPTRNNSVFDLISAAGGGSISFVSVSSTQSVNPVVGTTPNAVASVTYNAPGGGSGGGLTAGNGVFLTDDGVSGGTALGFPQGTLSNAQAGGLVVVFDVNFMQSPSPFLENLSLYIGGALVSGGATAVPTLSVYGLLLTTLGLLVLAIRRLRTSARMS